MNSLPIRTFRARVLWVDAGLLGLSVLLGWILQAEPDALFAEGGVVTFLSAGHLILTGWLLYRVAKVRSAAKASRIWSLMALGFIYLAFDETLKLHEGIDDAAHYLLGWEPTDLTDRLDDMIVGLYGLLGLGLMAFYRNELKQYKSSLWFLFVGMLFLYLMVALDTLINRDNLLILVLETNQISRAIPWLEVCEEASKIISEAFLVIAAYEALRVARRITLGVVESGPHIFR